MEFAYPTQEARDEAINVGDYIPENAAPLCIAATPNRIFVSTPRWNKAIPASLSTISLPAFSKSPALEPYPDWSSHITTTSTTNPDCTKIVSVYRQAIDECGRLFVVDTGFVHALIGAEQLCPPKILVYDLNTDELIVNYTLPADQVLQGSLHANIIVDTHTEDCSKTFAYVMDIFRNEILVFDFAQKRSWRTSHPYYMPDPLYSAYTYRELNFFWTDGVFGGALSPQTKLEDDRTLYFHPMSSTSVR